MLVPPTLIKCRMKQNHAQRWSALTSARNLEVSVWGLANLLFHNEMLILIIINVSARIVLWTIFLAVQNGLLRRL